MNEFSCYTCNEINSCVYNQRDCMKCQRREEENSRGKEYSILNSLLISINVLIWIIIILFLVGDFYGYGESIHR